MQEWLTGIEVLDIHKRYAKKISSHVQSLKKSLNELKVELKKLSAPPGIEEEQPAVVPGETFFAIKKCLIALELSS